MTDIRPTIDQLLDELEITELDHEWPPEGQFFTKAGILPFLPAPAMENWRFLLMKPAAEHPDKGPPALQLAKGTRMQKVGSQWLDIQPGESKGKEPETLAVTALREGVEELGLNLLKVDELFDAGPVNFTSIKTGEKKWMWLFAAMLSDEKALLPEGSLAKTTAARSWIRLPDLPKHCRKDHLPIIGQTVRMLAAELTPSKD